VFISVKVSCLYVLEYRAYMWLSIVVMCVRVYVFIYATVGVSCVYVVEYRVYIRIQFWLV
jgi:hypothetical protein